MTTAIEMINKIILISNDYDKLMAIAMTMTHMMIMVFIMTMIMTNW